MPSLIDDLAVRARTVGLAAAMSERQFANPPLTGSQIAAAEANLGFPLPSVLRDIYLHIGDGGFGPGYGLFRLNGGPVGPYGFHDAGIVDLYRSFRQQRCALGDDWAERLLPICHWGCTYYSYVDCALASAPVMSLDENSHGYGPWGCAIALHDTSLESWLRRWLAGENLWKSFGTCGEPIFWGEIVEARAQGAT